MAPDNRTLKAVSLFSNCGAGDLGYRESGFRFVVMAELLEQRLRVALLNHPQVTGVVGDLRFTLDEVVDRWLWTAGRDKPALLAACPPCQGLSTARGDRGLQADADSGSRDDRNLLVNVIAEAVGRLAPRAVVIENVPPFLRRLVRDPRSGAGISAAVLIIEALHKDYVSYPVLLDLADYGIPQTRKRTFITFLRRDEPGIEVLASRGLFPYPAPTHVGNRISAREALDSMGLPPLNASTARKARDRGRPLHQVPVWDATRYRMVKAIPRNSGRSAWQNSVCASCKAVTAKAGATHCANCLEPLSKPLVRDEDGNFRMIRGFQTSSYRRIDPAVPAPTITTASGHVGSHRTIHPSQTRVLSILECALLQTFPAGFDWGDSLEEYGTTNVRAMIGEAVPPAFTELHGRVLAKILAGEAPKGPMASHDLRVRRASAALRQAGHVVD